MNPKELEGRARERFARNKDVDLNLVMKEEKYRVAELNANRETMLERLEAITLCLSEKSPQVGLSRLIPLGELEIGGKPKRIFVQIDARRDMSTHAFGQAKLSFFGEDETADISDALAERKTIEDEEIRVSPIGSEVMPDSLEASTFSFPHAQTYADRLGEIDETIEWIEGLYQVS